GVIIDRLGRRPAMIGGPIMLVAGALTSALTPSFLPLLAGQFLSGAGVAIWQLGREVAAVDLMRPEVRGRMLSLFFGLQSAGSSLGPLAGGLVKDHWELRGVFWISAALGIVVLALSARVPETGHKRARSAKQPLIQFGKLRDLAPQFRVTYLVL